MYEKNVRALLASLFIVFFILCVMKTTYAQEIGAVVGATSINTYEGVLLKAAPEISLVGKTVTDDVYLAGNTISIDGVILGDVLIVGGNVKIEGIVKHDVRILAKNVFINGQVEGNVSLIGSSIEFGPKASLSKNVIIGADKLVVNGPVLGKGNVSAQTIVFNSPLNEDWQVVARKITFDEHFWSTKAIVYRSPTKAVFSPSAVSSGDIIFKQTSNTGLLKTGGVFPVIDNFLRVLFISGKIFEFAVLLGAGGVLMRMFPEITENLLQTANHSYIYTSMKGLGISVAMISVIVGSAVTLIGIPLALSLSVIAILIMFAALLTANVIIGKQLIKHFSKQERRGWALAVGLSIYFMFGFIPYFGMLYMIVLISLGIGILYEFVLKERTKLK